MRVYFYFSCVVIASCPIIHTDSPLWHGAEFNRLSGVKPTVFHLFTRSRICGTLPSRHSYSLKRAVVRLGDKVTCILRRGRSSKPNLVKCEERENQQDATIRCLLSTSVSTCFGHHYARLQENKDHVTAYGVLLWFCWMWLVAVVGRCGSAPQPLPTTSSRTRAVHHMQ